MAYYMRLPLSVKRQLKYLSLTGQDNLNELAYKEAMVQAMDDILEEWPILYDEDEFILMKDLPFQTRSKYVRTLRRFIGEMGIELMQKILLELKNVKSKKRDAKVKEPSNLSSVIL